jgi:hypothetical protein
MGLNFVKPTVQVELKPVEVAVDLAVEKSEAAKPKVIDMTEAPEEVTLTVEYLTLHGIYESFEYKKTLNRMEELRKHLQLIANHQGLAAEPYTFQCNEGSITFGPRANTVKVSKPGKLMKDILEKFGQEALEEVVSFSVTDLRKLFSEKELEKYIENVPGSRSIKKVEHIL